MKIIATFHKKALLHACVAVLVTLFGNTAFAADACAVAEGRAPLIFNYGFRSSYDISALAVGSVIDAVTVTATDTFRTACPGNNTPGVVAGIVPGGGLTTNAFGGFDTLATRVAGVGVRITTTAGAVWLPYPQSGVPSTGPSRNSWTITFFKTGSDNTGNDTISENASSTVAIGDNRLRGYQYVLPNAIQFMRGRLHSRFS